MAAVARAKQGAMSTTNSKTPAPRKGAGVANVSDWFRSVLRTDRTDTLSHDGNIRQVHGNEVMIISKAEKYVSPGIFWPVDSIVPELGS